ncbi:hypothetical protein Cgig2_000210 [Carnegiea gigantea]|uniref:Uncharacterized protein n=1 Tax=Carnegiea gigantea TaxID=171969 RepID=A0A9Q1JM56_9CARY|nr:hypothetical protein Cgig2_000210 [Carnegiea gigantea]
MHFGWYLARDEKSGTFYTWTNRHVWLNIDMVFTNMEWFSIFGFVHVDFLATGLSDHSPILLTFLASVQPTHIVEQVVYKSMTWTPILHSCIGKVKHSGPILVINVPLCFFFPRVKHRKMANYVYSLEDKQGNMVEEFYKVATVVADFYEDFPAKQGHQRELIAIDMTQQGKVLSIEQNLALTKPFTDEDIKQVTFSISSHKSQGLYPCILHGRTQARSPCLRPLFLEDLIRGVGAPKKFMMDLGQRGAQIQYAFNDAGFKYRKIKGYKDNALDLPSIKLRASNQVISQASNQNSRNNQKSAIRESNGGHGQQGFLLKAPGHHCG